MNFFCTLFENIKLLKISTTVHKRWLRNGEKNPNYHNVKTTQHTSCLWSIMTHQQWRSLNVFCFDPVHQENGILLWGWVGGVQMKRCDNAQNSRSGENYHMLNITAHYMAISWILLVFKQTIPLKLNALLKSNSHIVEFKI